MQDQQNETSPEQRVRQAASKMRKPFVPPRWRCEAELANLTAGRFFTLSTIEDPPDPS